ncbi:hypothetical protein Tco_1281776 [Tanacetum coccineum]
MIDTYFVEYTRLEVQHFRDTLLQHLGNVKKSVAERTRHQRQYKRRVNKRQMQTQESKIDTGKALDADLVDTESIRTDSTVQDDSSRSGNDTDADDADIRPIYDEEPMAEVQLTAECNIFAIGQQHTEQPEIIVEGRVDQYPETCQVKSPMLDSSPDNQTTEYSKQSLESENILLKETVAQFQKDFSRMEAHCIALELKYQNQSLKSGQHGQILNETSNKAKIEKEINVFETMNIELEHKQTTSLLANNAELKAQIQEKVFAIAALKNDLRKLKGNNVDTKFDKTSVLGKPVLPSLRNQSVVRQPNAFKSARAQMSKQRFASQVDVNKNLSKPVTQHYLPKKTESTFAKPDHMIASSSSRNSSKNMPRFSSNDMVHNHYLDVAKKKIQERDRNSTTSVPTSARIQTTTDDRKPNPRSNNQTSRSLPVSKSSRVTITAVPKADHSKSSSSFSDSKNFVCSTCHKCVFNANHDACITKLLKEVNSRAKIQSNKTTNSNKPVDQKSHTQKPSRQIFTGHRNFFDLMHKRRVDSVKSPNGKYMLISLDIHDCANNTWSRAGVHQMQWMLSLENHCQSGFTMSDIELMSLFTHSSGLNLNVEVVNELNLNPEKDSKLSDFTLYVLSALRDVSVNEKLQAWKAKRTTEISQSSGPIPLVADETVIKEWEDRMERAATTASSLEAEQDSGNINRTQSMATLNESFPQGTDSGSGPRCQDTILGGAEAQIRFEAASKQSNDPPLSRVNTLGSGEDNMKLKELMEFCTKLSVRAFDL